MPFTLPAPTYNASNYAGTLIGAWANFTALAAEIVTAEANIAALQAQIALAPQSLFDHFANASTSGTGVVALYTDAIAGGQLSVNGQSIHFFYAGTTSVTNTGTRNWFVSFAGTNILDTNTLASSQQMGWRIEGDIVRDSANSVRCSVEIVISKSDRSNAIYSAAQTVNVGALTLTNPLNLILSGQASVSGNDITATEGKIQFVPA